MNEVTSDKSVLCECPYDVGNGNKMNLRLNLTDILFQIDSAIIFVPFID